MTFKNSIAWLGIPLGIAIGVIVSFVVWEAVTNNRVKEVQAQLQRVETEMQTQIDQLKSDLAGYVSGKPMKKIVVAEGQNRVEISPNEVRLSSGEIERAYLLAIRGGSQLLLRDAAGDPKIILGATETETLIDIPVNPEEQQRVRLQVHDGVVSANGFKTVGP